MTSVESKINDLYLIFLASEDKENVIRQIISVFLLNLKEDLLKINPLTLEIHSNLIIHYHASWVRLSNMIAQKEKRVVLKTSGFLEFLVRLFPKEITRLRNINPELDSLYL